MSDTHDTKQYNIRLVASITQVFLPLGGTLLIAVIDSYLNANACTTPFSLWVLDGYIRILIHDQVSPGPVLGRRRFHELEDIYRLDY